MPDRYEFPLNQRRTFLTLPNLMVPRVEKKMDATILNVPGLVQGLSICITVFLVAHQINIPCSSSEHTSLPPQGWV